MMIIPAVDIKNGNCVRLLQGRMDAETIFSTNPSEMAFRWAGLGAEMLHIVDLDGAFEKSPRNLKAIQDILHTVQVPIQVGGGIRDIKTIEQYIALGVAKIVIGTEAIRNPQLVRDACKLYPGRIVVGIDARKGRVAIEGWTTMTDVLAIDLARQYEDCGVAAINFTDIHRDGMQTGPNIEETQKLAEAVSIPVVASGGVSTIQDIRNLLPLVSVGVIGVITGKALYAGTLSLSEAIQETTRRRPDI
jgi:phosphoribosylformimino-5-aminoimidazole carboxamide ribotide isomerase